MITSKTRSECVYLFAFTGMAAWGDFSRFIAPELIPVANRPFLEWVISRLVDSGYKEFYFYTSDYAKEYFDLLGTGQRWGVNIKFSAVIDEEHAVDRFRGQIDSNGALVVDCGLIPLDFDSSLLENGEDVFWGSDEVGSGWVYLSDDTVRYVADNQDIQKVSDIIESVRRKTGVIKPLSDVVSCRNSFELLRANSVFLSSKEYKDYIPGNEVEDSVFLEAGVVMHPTARVNSVSAIGGYSSLGRGSCLYNFSTLGRNCRIGDMTTLRNAVILDDTVIGENLNFEDCIVAGNLMIRSGSNVGVLIPDKFIAGRTVKIDVGEYAATIVKYLALLLLLPLVIPVFVILYGLLRLSGIEKPVIKKEVISLPSIYMPELYNTFLYREFVETDDKWIAVLMKCRILKRLPTFYNLLVNTVDWFGVQERSREELEQMKAGDRDMYLQGRVGVFRLSELDGAESGDNSSERVSELFYVLNRSVRLNYRIFVRYLKRLFVL